MRVPRASVRRRLRAPSQRFRDYSAPVRRQKGGISVSKREKSRFMSIGPNTPFLHPARLLLRFRHQTIRNPSPANCFCVVGASRYRSESESQWR